MNSSKKPKNASENTSIRRCISLAKTTIGIPNSSSYLKRTGRSTLTNSLANFALESSSSTKTQSAVPKSTFNPQLNALPTAIAGNPPKIPRLHRLSFG
jgi:hypothetical protein